MSLNEEQKKFRILQEKFFEKLNNSEFNVEELKKYGQQFGLVLKHNDEKNEKSQNLQRKLKKEQERFKKTMKQSNLNDPNQSIEVRRETL